MKTKIIQAAESEHISAVGFCDADPSSELKSFLEERPTVEFADFPAELRSSPTQLLPGAKTVIVCLFSYYNGKRPENISRYSACMDYHRVVMKKLGVLVDILKNSGYIAEAYTDSTPLNERYFAKKAGLGFIGDNGFLISPKFGSYVFIGHILTDCTIAPSAPCEIESCMHCGACKRACPSKDECLSLITQKKGELTELEKSLMKSANTAWGCDICQDVCPHNKNLPITQISEFSENMITKLEIDSNISNKEFSRRYSDRAFCWRGKNVILRNLEIINND